MHENHIDKAIDLLQFLKTNNAFVHNVSIDYGFEKRIDDNDSFASVNKPDGTFIIVIKGNNLKTK